MRRRRDRGRWSLHALRRRTPLLRRRPADGIGERTPSRRPHVSMVSRLLPSAASSQASLRDMSSRQPDGCSDDASRNAKHQSFHDSIKAARRLSSRFRPAQSLLMTVGASASSWAAFDVCSRDGATAPRQPRRIRRASSTYWRTVSSSRTHWPLLLSATTSDLSTSRVS